MEVSIVRMVAAGLAVVLSAVVVYRRKAKTSA